MSSFETKKSNGLTSVDLTSDVTGVLPVANGGTGNTAGTATSSNALESATTTVSVSAATAPTSGQVLTATNSTTATWQTPSAGGGGKLMAGVISGVQVLGVVEEIPVQDTVTASELRISLKVQPTGANFIVTLYKNGVSEGTATITTAQSATNGLYQATLSSFTSGSYVATDVLKLEITQIGSSVAGSDFTYQLK